jgi:WD40 repeat protein
VIAVADAIAYAHGRNIIHRDLKPSNVIVGDFGETVVIDWGLAKDLTVAEESTVGGGPFRAARDEGLTSAGAIMGTPAYMAPEQARGEPVDQRADVFAIGAMLWELCSLEKLPPHDAGQRRRILRRARIDTDLVTIIDKALDPDLARRYPDAGALAADLKAFKAGARIAARRYSPLAMAAHWTRRHRALTFSIAAVLALAVAGSVMYLHDIAAERMRAVRSEQLAQRAQSTAEASLDALTLKHAELLLSSDPSAAMDALATYHGGDAARAGQLRAEALGRGTARLRATPHSDAVNWIHGNPDGSIVSFSVDGTIVRTSPDGGTVILARDVVHRGLYAYSAPRHLLAYACDPADVCVLDVVRGEHYRVQEPDGVQLDGVDFSPDGSAVASISQTGELRVFDIADPSHPVERAHISTGDGIALLYVAADTIAVGVVGSLKVVHLDGRTQEYRDPEGVNWDADTKQHRLAIATTRGEGLLAETEDLRITARATLCHGAISWLRFVPGQNTVAFVCSEGMVGTWDLATGKATPRAQVDGHAHMIEVSDRGDYLLASSDNGVLTAIDLTTGLTMSFRGHLVHLVAIAPPTSDFPFFLSGDVRGQIRSWPMPARAAAVVVPRQGQIRSAAFSATADAVIATPPMPRIVTYSPVSGLRFVTPHDENATLIEVAGDGTRFMTYGASEAVEIWNARAMSRDQVIDTHQGSVTRGAFVAETGDVVTSGRDGRLVRWTPSGQSAVIAAFHDPITDFALAATTGEAVAATADGALWRTREGSGPLRLSAGGTAITDLRASPDAVTVLAGYANGDIIAVDTRSWSHTPILHTQNGIRHIVFSSDGDRVASADAGGLVHVGARKAGSWSDAVIEWKRLRAPARDMAFTPDGLLVVACAGGVVWVYSSSVEKWLYLPLGTVDLAHIVVNTGGTYVVVIDDEGRMISIDLREVRRTIGT